MYGIIKKIHKRNHKRNHGAREQRFRSIFKYALSHEVVINELKYQKAYILIF